MMGEPGEDNEDDPATQRVALAMAAAEEVRPQPEGPEGGKLPQISILGERGGVYYFISRSGELRSFSAKDLTKLNIGSLFGGDIEWLQHNFPVTRRKSAGRKAFDAEAAAFWLMEKCRTFGGNFDPETPMRGLGVWRAGDDIVAHLGAAIWYRDMRRDAGCVLRGAIYSASTKMEEPDFEKPAARHDGQWLRQHLNAWAFTQDYDADFLIGFIGAALLGGFPHWRVHAFITGEAGSGKSTLARYTMDALGAQGEKMNDYTEAGFRQNVTNQGRVTFLDEGENAGDDQGHRMGKIVSFIRKMSDDVGARVARGTSGGKAINTMVTGCVLISAINTPPLQPQDRSRILLMPIDKPSGNYSPQDIRIIRREVAKLSPRLRARALLGAKRFDATFDLYQRYLRQHGCDDRRADFFGTILAGRSLLLDDEIPEESAIKSYVANLRDRLSLIMIDDSDASDGQSCLNRLLDTECAAIRDGLKHSIGQIVANCMNMGSLPQNEKLLPLGIRIVDLRENDYSRERALFVANDHLGLKRIFHNTPWADGNWRASLRRLPGVKPSPSPVFVGRKSRGLLIPKSLLPQTEPGDDELDIHHDPPNPSPL